MSVADVDLDLDVDAEIDADHEKGGGGGAAVILPSLFSDRPGTIYFPVKGEKPDASLPRMKGLKKQVHRNLYFKICGEAVEYMCVKSAFKRAGFKQITESDTSYESFSLPNCIWSKHLKQEEYGMLNRFQKTNHFPGTWAIGRKDNLARNLARMKRLVGGEEYDFFPGSYLLPQDFGLLVCEMERNPNAFWISKPPASACGRGIRLVDGPKALSKSKKQLVQRYIDNPMTINGYKFDLRIYVAVTSFDPLRIHMFDDGLTRFSTAKYSKSAKTIKNRFMHLTNYAVNKKSKDFVKNTDDQEDGTGSKWSLKAFRKYLQDQGIDDDALFLRIEDVIIKTIIAADAEVNTKLKRSIHDRGACFELFGFDVLLDENLKPYVIEVNIMPSLSASSPMDKSIKYRLLSDLFHLAGFVPYDRKKWAKEVEDRKQARLLGFESNVSSAAILPTHAGSGSSDEHASSVSPKGNTLSVFNRQRTVFDLMNCSLDELTEEELIILKETYDEENRARGFRRIFPNSNTGKYQAFFDSPRYYNILLQKWFEEKRTIDQLLNPRMLTGQAVAALPSTFGQTGPPSPATMRLKLKSASRRGSLASISDQPSMAAMSSRSGSSTVRSTSAMRGSSSARSNMSSASSNSSRVSGSSTSSSSAAAAAAVVGVDRRFVTRQSPIPCRSRSPPVERVPLSMALVSSNGSGKVPSRPGSILSVNRPTVMHRPSPSWNSTGSFVKV
eukprot:ANDGO_05127.mRNA.1 Tubulin polyglutamylase ttll-4